MIVLLSLVFILLRVYITHKVGLRRIWSYEPFEVSFTNYLKMLFSFHKWTYKQFFPE
jgi:hypothetical protein